MKRMLIVLLIAVIVLPSCADRKTIRGVTYEPYGFANEQAMKNDSIYYEIDVMSVVVGVIFIEFIIPPIYVAAYDLYEPVCHISEKNLKNKGVVK